MKKIKEQLKASDDDFKNGRFERIELHSPRHKELWGIKETVKTETNGNGARTMPMPVHAGSTGK